MCFFIMLQVSIIHYVSQDGDDWTHVVAMSVYGCRGEWLFLNTNRGDLSSCLHLQVCKSLYGVRDAKRMPPTAMRQVAMFSQESPLSIQGLRP
jgi:hypothetical protein